MKGTPSNYPVLIGKVSVGQREHHRYLRYLLPRISPHSRRVSTLESALYERDHCNRKHHHWCCQLVHPISAYLGVDDV